MAIKRRFAKPVAVDIEAIDPVTQENVVTVTTETETIIVRPTRKPTKDTPDMHMMRLAAFSDGNAGRQRHPKDVSTEQLLAGVRYVQNTDDFARIEKFYRDRIRSPLTAIRAFMVLGEGGPKKANDDTGTQNPLWAFRDGTNPFYGRFRNENEEADDDDTD